MGFLTVDLHVWPDFHGNRSPLADLTLKGMVSDIQSLHKGKGRPEGYSLGEAKCGERKRGNINTTAQQPTGFLQTPPVGKALAAPRGDLLKVLIVAEPPFGASRAVFLSWSYRCLCPLEGLEVVSPRLCNVCICISLKSCVFHPQPQAAGCVVNITAHGLAAAATHLPWLCRSGVVSVQANIIRIQMELWQK